MRHCAHIDYGCTYLQPAACGRRGRADGGPVVSHPVVPGRLLGVAGELVVLAAEAASGSGLAVVPVVTPHDRLAAGTVRRPGRAVRGIVALGGLEARWGDPDAAVGTKAGAVSIGWLARRVVGVRFALD